MQVDLDRQRQKAAALARALEPMIAAHYTADAAPPPLRAMDRPILRAAVALAETVSRLEQSKFGPGEIAARRALERAATTLRQRLRESGHVR